METRIYWPTLISHVDYKGDLSKLVNYSYQIKKEIPSGGEGWISDVYNTNNKFNVLSDKIFKTLNLWVIENINLHCKKLNSKDILKPHNGWLNIYKKYSFQEFHTHPGATLSAIFILKANAEKDAKIYFENYRIQNSDTLDMAGSDRIFYKSVPGRLIIFESSLRHSVEQQKNDSDRITIAYNFGKRDV